MIIDFIAIIMVLSSIIMPIFLYLLHRRGLKNEQKKNTLTKFEKFWIKFFTKFRNRFLGEITNNRNTQSIFSDDRTFDRVNYLREEDVVYRKRGNIIALQVYGVMAWLVACIVFISSFFVEKGGVTILASILLFISGYLCLFLFK